MTPAEIIAIIQLVQVLEPAAVGLVNNMVASFSSSELTTEERMKMLNDLSASLKPMEPKVA